MTITARLNPGLAGGGRSDSLNAYAARLYERPGPMVAVVEIQPVDRVMPVSPDSAKDGVIRLRLDSFEVAAPGEQERILREVLRLLFLSRTAEGTLDADNEIEIAEATLAHATDLVAGELVASLKAILDWAVTGIREVAGNEKLRPVDVRKALGQIADRAAAARIGVHEKDGPSW
jgi:hypothetical protein